ncbi:hypothetical protein BY996DRAFT_6477249 [Phakopsora pachyrhizi]|nr:hypothetical protein BY996DRAFT_6477249 [Phakopsora pachyrhizi]
MNKICPVTFRIWNQEPKEPDPGEEEKEVQLHIKAHSSGKNSHKGVHHKAQKEKKILETNYKINKNQDKAKIKKEPLYRSFNNKSTKFTRSGRNPRFIIRPTGLISLLKKSDTIPARAQQIPDYPSKEPTILETIKTQADNHTPDSEVWLAILNNCFDQAEEEFQEYIKMRLRNTSLKEGTFKRIERMESKIREREPLRRDGEESLELLNGKEDWKAEEEVWHKKYNGEEAKKTRKEEPRHFVVVTGNLDYLDLVRVELMNLHLKFRNKERTKEIQDLSQSLDMTNDDSRENRREPTRQ